KLPFWRVAVNNWFGILPILETVLPPSFNANELYDPLRRIEAPFTFPMSKEAFEAMETGSIKSYAISGGINLGVETTEGMHGFKDIVTAGKSGAELKLPYTIFRSGEYRVSVLKRDLNTAWVGITDTNRTGHRIESKVGKTYFLLSETIPYWKGLAAPIFPLDFSIEEAVSDLFGRVYSFDFRNTEAQSAYLEAVHGNLASGQLSWLRHREDKLDTGVSFFYTKKEKRFETSIGAGLSLFVINKGSKRIHSDAEIEIVDPQGRFYILEARQNKDQKLWDILTGSSTSNYSAVTDLRVRKVIEGTPADPDKFRYDFVADLNPIETVLTLQTIDKFVETEDFQKYLTTIGSFTGIDLLGELPGIPIRDEEKLEQRRRTTAFETDLKKPLNLHTTPTHLGSFEGYASVHIRTTDLNRIADQPKDAMWGAFCRGFNISRNRCGIWQESAFSRDLDRAGGVMATPLNLFDIFLSRLDALSEIEDAIDALQMFKRDADPTKKRDHLRRLLSTAYPLALAHALMELAGPENISRNVQLGTTPKGNGSEAAKSLFKAVNGRRFHRGPKDPEAARYDSTLDTESKFNPANVTFAGARPHIKRLALFREDEDPISGDTNLTAVPRLSVRLYATRLEDAPDIRIYVRVEQTGKVQLAKFKLAEQVFEVPIAEAGFDFEAGTSNYLLRLTGPKAVIQSMILSEAISLGGTFRATFAVSTNGITWSDESHLDFRIDNGLLLPGD
ncbi:MAG: hypothetical protein NTV34_17375, partial [Proteobacteria bacterium]|nr:hypothetical protein [Pseudomonadota bacterium]